MKIKISNVHHDTIKKQFEISSLYYDNSSSIDAAKFNTKLTDSSCVFISTASVSKTKYIYFLERKEKN